MSSVAVMGIGFGDEGKGATTDWLASRVTAPTRSMVVRFSGGAQSGHTVVVDKVRHVFSQFGSGTLRGLPTYYSRFCTFDPLAFQRERAVLDSKGLGLTTYWLSAFTPVVTPMDILANREDLRSLHNGTVGSGHGATLAREEAHYSLLAGDLLYPDVWQDKLNMIWSYYTRDRWSGLPGCNPARATQHLDDFREACRWLTQQSWVRVTDASPRHIADTLIFEGSQGLLLDEDIGFFPHVTRGHTDTRHIRNLMDGREVDSYYLVTRGYHTRHGNGPLPWEGFGIEVSEYEGETNVTHEYQGAFRRAPLNVALLAYGLGRDPSLCSLTSCRSERVSLVVTCLDRMKEHVYVGNGSPTHAQSERHFLGTLSALLGIPRVYANRAAAAGSLQEVTW